MPNFERLTGCLWAAWTTDGNLELAASDPAGEHGDAYRHVVVQVADLPDLVSYIARRPGASVEETPPAAAAPVTGRTSSFVDKTNKALDTMHNHPGPFQTEAVMRLLHQRVTVLELVADGAGERRQSVQDAIARIDELAAKVDGADGIAGSLAELAIAVDSMQTTVGNLQTAATMAPAARSEDEQVTRTWVRDEIGQAVRRHAGAMHEVIARTAAALSAYVLAQTAPRPTLLRRLIAAVSAPPEPAAQVKPSAVADVSPDKLQELARAAVAATGVKGS